MRCFFTSATQDDESDRVVGKCNNDLSLATSCRARRCIHSNDGTVKRLHPPLQTSTPKRRPLQTVGRGREGKRFLLLLLDEKQTLSFVENNYCRLSCVKRNDHDQERTDCVARTPKTSRRRIGLDQTTSQDCHDGSNACGLFRQGRSHHHGFYMRLRYRSAQASLPSGTVWFYGRGVPLVGKK